MSAPVELRGPAAAAIPLVLDSPHSGHFFPGDFDAVVSEAELREGEDCYVDELYAGGPEIGAPLLAALWPRTYLDPNRHAGDVDLDLIEGSWPGEYRPSGKAKVVSLSAPIVSSVAGQQVRDRQRVEAVAS